MISEHIHIQVRTAHEQALRDIEESEAAIRRLATELEDARRTIRVLEEENRILKYVRS